MIKRLIRNYLSIDYASQCLWIRQEATKAFANEKIQLRFVWQEDMGTLPLWKRVVISFDKKFIIIDEYGNISGAEPSVVANRVIDWLGKIERNIDSAFILLQRYGLLNIREDLYHEIDLLLLNGESASVWLDNITTKRLGCVFKLPFAKGFEIDELPDPEIGIGKLLLKIIDLETLQGYGEQFLVMLAFVNAIQEILWKKQNSTM